MRRQLTEVSMVISNAGSLTCAPINQYRPDAIARLLEVNLLAHFWVTNELKTFYLIYLVLKKPSVRGC